MSLPALAPWLDPPLLRVLWRVKETNIIIRPTFKVFTHSVTQNTLASRDDRLIQTIE